MATSGIFTSPGSVVAGIVAFATGGQANAVQLTAGINLIATCATAADSVKLPVGLPTLSRVFVRNGGAASCNVFPPVGGTINGAAANAAFAVAAAKTAEFISASNDGLTLIANLSA